MILANWIKRIKKKQGFSAFSAGGWGKLCNVVEGVQGMGCQVIKTRSGKGWIILCDGKSSDLPFPEGAEPSGFGGGIPDGTEIWGRMAYDADEHKWYQYKLKWESASSSFVEDPLQDPTEVLELESHLSQH